MPVNFRGFSERQLKDWKGLADKLNKEYQGNQAAFFISLGLTQVIRQYIEIKLFCQP
jgi:hypothetical protein